MSTGWTRNAYAAWFQSWYKPRSNYPELHRVAAEGQRSRALGGVGVKEAFQDGDDVLVA